MSVVGKAFGKRGPAVWIAVIVTVVHVGWMDLSLLSVCGINAHLEGSPSALIRYLRS
jgi:hypothetical protein